MSSANQIPVPKPRKIIAPAFKPEEIYEYQEETSSSKTSSFLLSQSASAGESQSLNSRTATSLIERVRMTSNMDAPVVIPMIHPRTVSSERKLGSKSHRSRVTRASILKKYIRSRALEREQNLTSNGYIHMSDTDLSKTPLSPEKAQCAQSKPKSGHMTDFEPLFLASSDSTETKDIPWSEIKKPHVLGQYFCATDEEVTVPNICERQITFCPIIDNNGVVCNPKYLKTCCSALCVQTSAPESRVLLRHERDGLYANKENRYHYSKEIASAYTLGSFIASLPSENVSFYGETEEDPQNLGSSFIHSVVSENVPGNTYEMSDFPLISEQSTASKSRQNNSDLAQKTVDEIYNKKSASTTQFTGVPKTNCDRHIKSFAGCGAPLRKDNDFETVVSSDLTSNKTLYQSSQQVLNITQNAGPKSGKKKGSRPPSDGTSKSKSQGSKRKKQKVVGKAEQSGQNSPTPFQSSAVKDVKEVPKISQNVVEISMESDKEQTTLSNTEGEKETTNLQGSVGKKGTEETNSQQADEETLNSMDNVWEKEQETNTLKQEDKKQKVKSMILHDTSDHQKKEPNILQDSYGEQKPQAMGLLNVSKKQKEEPEVSQLDDTTMFASVYDLISKSLKIDSTGSSELPSDDLQYGAGTSKDTTPRSFVDLHGSQSFDARRKSKGKKSHGGEMFNSLSLTKEENQNKKNKQSTETESYHDALNGSPDMSFKSNNESKDPSVLRPKDIKKAGKGPIRDQKQTYKSFFTPWKNKESKNQVDDEDFDVTLTPTNPNNKKIQTDLKPEPKYQKSNIDIQKLRGVLQSVIDSTNSVFAFIVRSLRPLDLMARPKPLLYPNPELKKSFELSKDIPEDDNVVEKKDLASGMDVLEPKETESKPLQTAKDIEECKGWLRTSSVPPGCDPLCGHQYEMILMPAFDPVCQRTECSYFSEYKPYSFENNSSPHEKISPNTRYGSSWNYDESAPLRKYGSPENFDERAPLEKYCNPQNYDESAPSGKSCTPKNYDESAPSIGRSSSNTLRHQIEESRPRSGYIQLDGDPAPEKSFTEHDQNDDSMSVQKRPVEKNRVRVNDAPAPEVGKVHPAKKPFTKEAEKASKPKQRKQKENSKSDQNVKSQDSRGRNKNVEKLEPSQKVLPKDTNENDIARDKTVAVKTTRHKEQENLNSFQNAGTKDSAYDLTSGRSAASDAPKARRPEDKKNLEQTQSVRAQNTNDKDLKSQSRAASFVRLQEKEKNLEEPSQQDRFADAPNDESAELKTEPGPVSKQKGKQSKRRYFKKETDEILKNKKRAVNRILTKKQTDSQNNSITRISGHRKHLGCKENDKAVFHPCSFYHSNSIVLSPDPYQDDEMTSSSNLSDFLFQSLSMSSVCGCHGVDENNSMVLNGEGQTKKEIQIDASTKKCFKRLKVENIKTNSNFCVNKTRSGSSKHAAVPYQTNSVVSNLDNNDKKCFCSNSCLNKNQTEQEENHSLPWVYSDPQASLCREWAGQRRTCQWVGQSNEINSNVTVKLKCKRFDKQSYCEIVPKHFNFSEEKSECYCDKNGHQRLPVEHQRQPDNQLPLVIPKPVKTQFTIRHTCDNMCVNKNALSPEEEQKANPPGPPPPKRPPPRRKHKTGPAPTTPAQTGPAGTTPAPTPRKPQKKASKKPTPAGTIPTSKPQGETSSEGPSPPIGEKAQPEPAPVLQRSPDPSKKPEPPGKKPPSRPPGKSTSGPKAGRTDLVKDDQPSADLSPSFKDAQSKSEGEKLKQDGNEMSEKSQPSETTEFKDAHDAKDNLDFDKCSSTGGSGKSQRYSKSSDKQHSPGLDDEKETPQRKSNNDKCLPSPSSNQTNGKDKKIPVQGGPSPCMNAYKADLLEFDPEDHRSPNFVIPLCSTALGSNAKSVLRSDSCARTECWQASSDQDTSRGTDNRLNRVKEYRSSRKSEFWTTSFDKGGYCGIQRKRSFSRGNSGCRRDDNARDTSKFTERCREATTKQSGSSSSKTCQSFSKERYSSRTRNQTNYESQNIISERESCPRSKSYARGTRNCSCGFCYQQKSNDYKEKPRQSCSFASRDRTSTRNYSVKTDNSSDPKDFWKSKSQAPNGMAQTCSPDNEQSIEYRNGTNRGNTGSRFSSGSRTAGRAFYQSNREGNRWTPSEDVQKSGENSPAQQLASSPEVSPAAGPRAFYQANPAFHSQQNNVPGVSPIYQDVGQAAGPSPRSRRGSSGGNYQISAGSSMSTHRISQGAYEKSPTRRKSSSKRQRRAAIEPCFRSPAKHSKSPVAYVDRLNYDDLDFLKGESKKGHRIGSRKLSFSGFRHGHATHPPSSKDDDMPNEKPSPPGVLIFQLAVRYATFGGIRVAGGVRVIMDAPEKLGYVQIVSPLGQPFITHIVNTMSFLHSSSAAGVAWSAIVWDSREDEGNNNKKPGKKQDDETVGKVDSAQVIFCEPYQAHRFRAVLETIKAAFSGGDGALVTPNVPPIPPANIPFNSCNPCNPCPNPCNPGPCSMPSTPFPCPTVPTAPPDPCNPCQLPFPPPHPDPCGGNGVTSCCAPPCCPQPSCCPPPPFCSQLCCPPDPGATGCCMPPCTTPCPIPLPTSCPGQCPNPSCCPDDCDPYAYTNAYGKTLFCQMGCLVKLGRDEVWLEMYRGTVMIIQEPHCMGFSLVLVNEKQVVLAVQKLSRKTDFKPSPHTQYGFLYTAITTTERGSLHENFLVSFVCKAHADQFFNVVSGCKRVMAMTGGNVSNSAVACAHGVLKSCCEEGEETNAEVRAKLWETCPKEEAPRGVHRGGANPCEGGREYTPGPTERPECGGCRTRECTCGYDSGGRGAPGYGYGSMGGGYSPAPERRPQNTEYRYVGPRSFRHGHGRDGGRLGCWQNQRLGNTERAIPGYAKCPAASRRDVPSEPGDVETVASIQEKEPPPQPPSEPDPAPGPPLKETSESGPEETTT